MSYVISAPRIIIVVIRVIREVVGMFCFSEVSDIVMSVSGSVSCRAPVSESCIFPVA